MPTLYLVRHAHANWIPDENRSLSERGYVDAHRVADLLQHFPITAIYSSPYRRARETIAPLAERLAMPVSMAPQLRERLLSGTPVDDFDAAVRATWDDFSFSHPGGETNAAAQQRVVTFVEALYSQHQGQHVVLSTHGNLLALLLQHVEPSVDFAFWQSLTMPDVFRWRSAPDEKTRIERLWSPSVE